MAMGSKSVEGQEGRPPENAVPVHYVIPNDLPAEYVTHLWLHDFGETLGTYQLTLHRIEVPIVRQSDFGPTTVEATCVARVVMSDETLKALTLLIGQVAGERLGLQVTQRDLSVPEQPEETS